MNERRETPFMSKDEEIKMDDLVKTARRAKGSDLLPKVSFGVMNAEALILRMVDRIEELVVDLEDKEAECRSLRGRANTAESKLSDAVTYLERVAEVSPNALAEAFGPDADLHYASAIITQLKGENQ